MLISNFQKIRKQTLVVARQASNPVIHPNQSYLSLIQNAVWHKMAQFSISKEF